MQIYTSTIDYEGPDRLDITVKSGDRVFAPTWEMVRSFQRGTMTQEQYTEAYVTLMRSSWKASNGRWREVLAMGVVTLCCCCPPLQFCHRWVLGRILVRVCEHLGISVEYCGERTNGLVQAARELGGQVIV